jgi:hypothetical protein
MLASPSDLRDYRTFRTAAHEGRRLYEAQRYLKLHPNGAWAEEVRVIFDTEEAAWFEDAKTSRVRAREYVVDLPDGPHADAARTLMVLFDEHQDDVETVALLADVRRTAAKLDYESGRRHRVSDTILADIGALADATTWGARLEAPPSALATVLRGDIPPTWGGGSHAQRHDSLIFVIPTPQGSQASVVDVTFQLWLQGGRIAEGVVQGDDLFVRWSEAERVRVLDAGNPDDRNLAVDTVVEIVGGALEATLPAARCTAPPVAPPQRGEILARACDGWSVSVRMGEGPGTLDVIDVRGPASAAAPAAVPERARAPGMR